MFESYSGGFVTSHPSEVKTLIDAGNVQILDVREVWEHDICRIEGSINIPLPLLPIRIHDLDKKATTVVLCHHGARSYHACRYLEKEGFHDIVNLGGGINAWSEMVDQSVPVY